MATTHRVLTRDGSPFDFVDGLKIKGVDVSGPDGTKAIYMLAKATDEAPTSLFDWVRSVTGAHKPFVTPYDYLYASPSGIVDTQVLQAWLDDIGTDGQSTGKLGLLPDGVYENAQKLILNKKYYTIIGAGSNNAVIKGAGFSLGSENQTVTLNWSGFTVDCRETIRTVDFLAGSYGFIFTVSQVTSGSLSVGDRLSLSGSAEYLPYYIVAMGTGTGGVGTYIISRNHSYSSGTSFKATKGDICIDASGTNQSIVNSRIQDVNLYGVTRAIDCRRFHNSTMIDCTISSACLAPALLRMSGGSKLDGVIAHSVPSYQPAFRLYGSGTVQRCVSDDTSITGSNTLMAVLGSNSSTASYRGDIYSLPDDTVDFEFIDCEALNFGFAAVALLGKWSKFNWVGGGFDRSARTDAYSGLIISTRGPIRDGLMIEFDPLYITPGTGVISDNDLLGMNFQGFYSKLITLDKPAGDYNNGIIDKSRLVPVISVNGTTQKPLVISQTAATNLIDATYNAGNLSSRFHIERVKRTDVASISVSASQTTIDVTGFSRIKLTGTNPSDSVSKVMFVNRELYTLEYTEEGYPILAKFNATVNNGVVGVAGNILNVTNVLSGQLSVGMRFKMPSNGSRPTILSFGTGTGGVGTYFINTNLSLVGITEEWIGYHPYGNDVGRNGELYIEFANTNVKLVHSTSGFGTFRLTAGVDYTPPYAGMVLRFLWSETLQQFIQA